MPARPDLIAALLLASLFVSGPTAAAQTPVVWLRSPSTPAPLERALRGQTSDLDVALVVLERTELPEPPPNDADASAVHAWIRSVCDDANADVVFWLAGDVTRSLRVHWVDRRLSLRRVRALDPATTRANATTLAETLALITRGALRDAQLEAEARAEAIPTPPARRAQEGDAESIPARRARLAREAAQARPLRWSAALELSGRYDPGLATSLVGLSAHVSFMVDASRQLGLGAGTTLPSEIRVGPATATRTSIDLDAEALAWWSGGLESSFRIGSYLGALVQRTARSAATTDLDGFVAWEASTTWTIDPRAGLVARAASGRWFAELRAGATLRTLRTTWDVRSNAEPPEIEREISEGRFVSEVRLRVGAEFGGTR